MKWNRTLSHRAPKSSPNTQHPTPNTLLLILALGALWVAAPQVVALSRGPAAITAEEVREHVKFLASDDLEGRGSGTAGSRKAARYIADHFRAAGLRPLGGKGSYFQRFSFPAGVKLGTRNALTLVSGAAPRGKALELREGFMPLAVSPTGRASGPVVFAGYGISAPELKHDDYAGADVRGKIVLALRFSPDGEELRGRFGRYADLRSKAATARDKGAAGILFVTGPLNDVPETVSDFRVDASFSDSGIPAAMVSRARVEELLKGTGRDLRALQTALAHGTVPAFAIPGARATLATDILRERRVTENVLGLLEGSDPKLKEEVVVIGAHYDHLGRGHRGSLAPGAVDEIHNGADDNASGTAGLLELAEYFAARRGELRRSLLFAAFSGEELGLLGSSYYVKNAPVPLERTVAMINMDMIGRVKEDTAIVVGAGTSPAWKELLDTVGKAHPLKLKSSQSGFAASDQASFYARKIPVLFFFSGIHADYHRPSDDWEKINAEGEARLLALVADVAGRISALPERPAYARAAVEEPAMPSGGFRVFIGTMPDYAEETEGVTLAGVRENSPAEKAGLRAGDVIVEFAGKKIRNVYDYTYALRDAEPGKPVPVVVLRAGKRETLTVTPARPPS